MPIYEYKCESCAAVLEKLQKLSDPPLSECPECGKNTLVKLVSAPSFRLKGSGWYETDFKTGKKKNGAGAASDNAAGSTKSGSDSDGGTKGDTAKSSEKASEKSGTTSTPTRTGTD